MLERIPAQPPERVETIHVVEEGGLRRREHRVRNIGAERRALLVKGTQIVRLLTVILEGALALRFGLMLIGANPASPFAQLVYGFTDLFLRPFQNLVASPQAGGMVLELTTLIAMGVYALVAWTLVRCLWVFFDRPAVGSRLEIDEVRED